MCIYTQTHTPPISGNRAVQDSDSYSTKCAWEQQPQPNCSLPEGEFANSGSSRAEPLHPFIPLLSDLPDPRD